MRPGRGDGAVADVVALVARAQVEDALDDALRAPDRGRQGAHHVLEAADRHVDGVLQLVDLVVVLHEPQLAQGARELLVRVARDHGDVDAGVIAAQRDDVGRREGDEVLLELVARRRGDVPSVPRLLEPSARPDPDLAKPGIAEEAMGRDVAALLRTASPRARGRRGARPRRRRRRRTRSARRSPSPGGSGSRCRWRGPSSRRSARRGSCPRSARGSPHAARRCARRPGGAAPRSGDRPSRGSCTRRTVGGGAVGAPPPRSSGRSRGAPRRRRARGTSCRRGSPLKCTGCTRRARGVRSPRGTRRRGRCPAAHAQGRRCGPGHGDATEALGVRRARAPRRACSDVVTRRSRRARRASDRVRRAPSAASDDGRHHRRHCVKFPSEAQQHRWYRVARLIR